MRRIPPVHMYGTPVEKAPADTSEPPQTFFDSPSSPDSLSPAIDGPPSPERIRAYTEAMRRGSIFGNNSRTGTLSSVSSEHATLSRQSSVRSNSSSMGCARSNRPESVQIFNSMFSRSGRKLKRENSTESGQLSISSVNLTEQVVGEESARDHYFGKKHTGTRTRKNISAPKNFQHITHTRQDQLPNLHRKSRMELASDFSAMRASQMPTHGKLKGIRATDLYFENFSSEALDTSAGEPSPKSPRQQFVSKTLASPMRAIGMTKSHDNLRTAPMRPPRSPLSQTCPPLPARTSSRTASVLFDQFDPLATTSLERPYTSGSFRKPAPFHLPKTPNLLACPWEEQEVTEQIISYAITTPGDEAWPLATSLSSTSGQNLTDVQEEEEELASRSSRLSAELRTSQSVPALRRRSPEKSTLARIPSNETAVPTKGSVVHEFQMPGQPGDSWESDIDWCYEHEVEADCDYQWDQCSDENLSDKTATIKTEQPELQLRVQDDEWVYKGRFRPSLLIPRPRDLEQLSPKSNPSSDLRRPALLNPKHIRASSRASSFKESHGFNLSPTLLIPADFQSQMEQDDAYHAQFIQDAAAAPIFNHESFTLPFSPIDENESSTASYRSSNFSHASSSSTQLSCATSRESQDSMILLNQAAMLSKAHRSIGSASSLPDLVYSKYGQAYSSNLSLNMAALSVEDEISDPTSALGVAGPASSLTSIQQRRKKFIAVDQEIRPFGLASDAGSSAADSLLSPVTPVPEMFPTIPRRPAHGRKFSAPISPSVKECKGRTRSSTISAGKARTSYALFPQI